MTDRAGLTGDPAAGDVGNDIELARGAGDAEGLVDDELQGLEPEVIVNVAVVDGDLAGAGIESDARDGALSSAGSVEIGFSARIHSSIPDLSSNLDFVGNGLLGLLLVLGPA